MADELRFIRLLCLAAGLWLWQRPEAFGQMDRLSAARSHLQAGRVDQARQLLLEIVGGNPGQQAAQALLGQIAFSRQQFQEAVDRFGQAPAILTSTPLLRINYAEALLETRSASLARRELASLPPSDAVAQFEAGLLLARHGDLAGAEQHFLKAKPHYPKPEVAAYNLALAQYSAGKLQECIATLEEARQKGFRSADGLNLLGQSYAEAGKNAPATSVLQEALRRYPKDERNYVSLTRILIEEDSATEALDLIQRGLAGLPNSPPLRMQRGYLLMMLGRHREAEADYRSVLASSTEGNGARIGLAFALIQSQRQDFAASLLEEAIKASPSDYFCRYLLAELYIRQGLDDQAEHHLVKAQSLQPRLAAIRSNLGKIYLRQGKLSAAIEQLETATRLDPADTTAYYQLSIGYRKAGQAAKAQQALAEVRRLNEVERELGTSRFLTRKLKAFQNALVVPAQ
jgi:predicted Zn-dependent protease